MKETDLQQQADSLPQTPGIYLFKDPKGAILYVGKAKDLRKRVRTYFQGKEQDIKTSIMLARVGQVDYIATQTEKEALILEDTLIKEHHPRYNIQLRDDKRYPLLRLGIQERLFRTLPLGDLHARDPQGNPQGLPAAPLRRNAVRPPFAPLSQLSNEPVSGSVLQ
jgi:excinuclease ABC subunit C